MKKIFVTALLFIGTLVAVPQTEAVFIVDTGAGNNGPSGITLYNLSATSNQYAAGQFTTTDVWNINSLESWILSTSTGGNVEAVIYSDSAGLPNTSAELYRQIFSVPAAGAAAPTIGWFGATGIDYVLDPGTYWLAMEAASAIPQNSLLMPIGVSSSLANHAVSGIGTGNVWVAGNPTPSGWGFRIDADRVPGGNVVPEPMTMMLFGTGLVGAAIRKRFNV